MITTFKPEIIKTAQAKIFEVTFKNRKSSMSEIGQEKALKIVSRDDRQQKNRPADEADSKFLADKNVDVQA